MNNETELVAIAGYGSIGRSVARALRAGIPGLSLAAIATRRPDAVQAAVDADGLGAAVVGLDELHLVADLVVECTAGALLPRIARPMLEAGKEIIVLSAGALLLNPDLIDTAERHGGRITVPTGALLGLDVVGAAALADRCDITIQSAKPPQAFAGAPYFDHHDVDLDQITEPTKLFAGSPLEAAPEFPANLNVSAALALAGVGADRTRAEVWADPSLDTNQHVVTIDSDAVRVQMKINNIPGDNPKTGRITALSVINLLRKRHASLVVGS